MKIIVIQSNISGIVTLSLYFLSLSIYLSVLIKSFKSQFSKCLYDVMSIVHDKLSVASWNIRGAKNKINDPTFLQELTPHDIIILCETFSDGDNIHVQGYKCKNISRTKKHKKARRNSGGISVLIKNTISEFVKPVKTTAEHLIWLRISKELTGFSLDTYCCCAYIPPINSPFYNNHNNINLFEAISEDITKFSKLGHIMCTGDLNARIGLKPDTLTEDDLNSHTDSFPDHYEIWAPERYSIDTKTNSWGNQLIDVCIAHNICLLNGRKVGDLEGRCTYFGLGSSSIDLSIVDRELYGHTLAFKVHSLTEYSDHCKIETILACKHREVPHTDPSINPIKFTKYTWNPDSSPAKLNTALKSSDFSKLNNDIATKNYSTSATDCDMFCEDVENLFRFLHENSCGKVKIGTKHIVKAKRQKWFTPDCQTMRKNVRRAANFLSRNPFNRQARDDFVSLNRKYRKLLKKVKKSNLEKNMKNLVESINKNEMWSILSDIRGKKVCTVLHYL